MITVVIPVFNRAHTILRTLRSIEAQTVMPKKVILIDNNSTDTSVEILKSWASELAERHNGVMPFIIEILDEAKPGACAARNRGLREVDTEFVMFFDSDDEMLPTHVADFTDAIRSHPDIDIFGRDIICQEHDGSRRKLYFTDRNPLFNHIFRGCLSTQRMVLRTSLVREVGEWNESLPAWNDYELGVRLLLASDRILDIKGNPTVITHHLTDSITGDSYSSRHDRWEHSLDTIDSHLHKAGMDNLTRWTDARRMILAAQYRKEASLTKGNVGSDALAQSVRLRNEVLHRSDAPRRMNLIYFHNLMFGRLTWVLVRLLFPASGK